MTSVERLKLPYVLITPARNEEAFIVRTIESMIAQTVIPEKWVIVDDGSTDSTGSIAESYMQDREWIELVRLPRRQERHFAAKVQGFSKGFERVKELPYAVIGNLDADIEFDAGYMEYLLGKFRENPRLGVAGTPFVEDGSKPYDYRYTNIEHVSGACQLFRRECFEDIGGYTPIRNGGIDWVAVTTARMKGWQTRTFTDKTCRHHRKIGTGDCNALHAWYRNGRKDYCIGNHPLWELFRCVYQTRSRPYLIGATALLLGYLRAGIARTQRSVSPDLVAFLRAEQMQRLRRILKSKVSASRKDV